MFSRPSSQPEPISLDDMRENLATYLVNEAARIDAVMNDGKGDFGYWLTTTPKQREEGRRKAREILEGRLK